MSLQPLALADLITLQSNAFAAQANLPIADGQGEPLSDIWGANALVALDIDQNVQYVSNKSRLLTAGNVSGANPQNEYSPDIDSYINPFGYYRIPAVYATGQVTFTPYSASSQPTFIPIGTIFSTTSGTQFQVVADSSQAAYQTNGYVVNAGSTSAITITVQSTVAGTAGNVQANTITQISSGLGQQSPPNGTVANSAAFSSGAPAETDQAFATRFQNEFISGRWGTNLAIAAAIAGVQTGLTFQLHELYYGSTSTPGAFTVYVNNLGSSSSAPSSLLNAVTTAIAGVKACGIQFEAISPTITTVPVAASIVPTAAWLANPNNSFSTLAASLTTAYDNYVNNIGLNPNGTSTYLSYLAVSSLFMSVPGVQYVKSYTLNSGTSDITASLGYQLVAGTATFTQTT